MIGDMIMMVADGGGWRDVVGDSGDVVGGEHDDMIWC